MLYLLIVLLLLPSSQAGLTFGQEGLEAGEVAINNLECSYCMGVCSMSSLGMSMPSCLVYWLLMIIVDDCKLNTVQQGSRSVSDRSRSHVVLALRLSGRRRALICLRVGTCRLQRARVRRPARCRLRAWWRSLWKAVSPHQGLPAHSCERVGSMYRGGAGGAAATKRKREENGLLMGLQKLLEAYAPQSSSGDADAPQGTQQHQQQQQQQQRAHVHKQPPHIVDKGLPEGPKDGKNRRARKNALKPRSLFQALRTVVDRAAKKQLPEGDLLKRLQALVQSAIAGHVGSDEQTQYAKVTSVQLNASDVTRPDFDKQVLLHKQRKEVMPAKPTYAQAAAAPKKQIYHGVKLRSADWSGTLTSVDDLLGCGSWDGRRCAHSGWIN